MSQIIKEGTEEKEKVTKENQDRIPKELEEQVEKGNPLLGIIKEQAEVIEKLNNIIKNLADR